MCMEPCTSTLAVPGLGTPSGLFVLEDGTRLVSTKEHTLQLLAPSGHFAALAGRRGERGKQDGPGADARFSRPVGITVDAAGQTVVADCGNHALRLVSKAGAVSTLAGGGAAGFVDGQGAAARFNSPYSVVVLPDSGEFVVSDCSNHALRVVTLGGAVRTLAGSGQRGFADGQGAAARFNSPSGLALNADGRSVLVADCHNHRVRRVTMAGAVSTVAGNGEAGFADGEGAAARFHHPTAVVADKAGTIVVADMCNHRLRKIVGGQVTTLAGGSEAGAADGAGAGALFNQPYRLALDERGRLLVTELGRADTLRVVEAGLAPPAWMGPVDPVAAAAAAAQAQTEEALETEKLKKDYGKLVGAPELADVVLLVGGERFPAHSLVLTARSAFFRGLLLSGMQEGSGEQELPIGEVSARAFRVVLRFLYTAELPAWGEQQDAATSGEDDEAAAGGQGRQEGDGTGDGGVWSKGMGKSNNKSKEAVGTEVEGGVGRAALALEVLKAADMLQTEGLLKHCLEGFRGALTVRTVVEHLVWAHLHGPVEARAIATKYFVAHSRAVRKEARESLELLKMLPVDVYHELLEAVLE